MNGCVGIKHRGSACVCAHAARAAQKPSFLPLPVDSLYRPLAWRAHGGARCRASVVVLVQNEHAWSAAPRSCRARARCAPPYQADGGDEAQNAGHDDARQRVSAAPGRRVRRGRVSWKKHCTSRPPRQRRAQTDGHNVQPCLRRRGAAAQQRGCCAIARAGARPVVALISNSPALLQVHVRLARHALEELLRRRDARHPARQRQQASKGGSRVASLVFVCLSYNPPLCVCPPAL